MGEVQSVPAVDTSTEPVVDVYRSALLDIMAFWEHPEHSTRTAGELMYQRAREALENA